VYIVDSEIKPEIETLLGKPMALSTLVLSQAGVPQLEKALKGYLETKYLLYSCPLLPT